MPIKGTYRMQISAIVFDPDDSLTARLVVYGQVHGLAGTDHKLKLPAPMGLGIYVSS